MILCASEHPPVFAARLILVLLLIIASYTDLRYRKVYNRVTFPALILGLGIGLAQAGCAGVLRSCLGAAAGCAMLLAFYLAGGIGAGDVKLLMAAGSLMGPLFVLMGGLYGAVIGGVAAVARLAARRRLRENLRNIYEGILLFSALRNRESLEFGRRGKGDALPYAVFLSAGMAVRLLEELAR